MSKKGIKRRGNGQGSAIRVGVNNWKAIAVVGYKPDGNPIRRTKQGFPTKTKALEYIIELKKEMSEKPREITLKAAYDKWIENYEASRLTINCYASGFKLFEPCWDIYLSNQDIDDLQSCIDNTDKGTRTRQNAKIALGLIYKWAVPRGYNVGRINYPQYIKVKAGTVQSNKRGFNLDELEIIKNSAGIVPFADIIYCHCYLGFRPQELLSLKSSDYDAEEKALKGGIKTEAGKNRIVTVSPKILPLIERFAETNPDGYLFSKDGSKMSQKVYYKEFYKALSKMGIQSESDHTLTPHSCRHTFATLLKNVTAPDRDKLRLIGHTDIKMLQYYQDVSYEDLREITNKL